MKLTGRPAAPTSPSRSAARAPCRDRSWRRRLGGRIVVIGLLSGHGRGRSDADPGGGEPAACRAFYVGKQADVRGHEPRPSKRLASSRSIDKVFPFAQARDAYRHLKSQNHFGKIVHRARRKELRCKNLWSDGDAKVSDRPPCRQGHRRRFSHCASTRRGCWAAEPRGWCCMAAANTFGEGQGWPTSPASRSRCCA